MPEKGFQKENQSQQGSSKAPEPHFSEAPVSVGMPWRLMIFSFVLFAFSILVFLGLRFGYDVYLDSQLESLNERVEQLSAEVSEGKQQQLLTFYSQFGNLERVLTKRGFSHNIFDFLEKDTLPSVYYGEAEYSGDDKSLRLAGLAESMKDLVEQIAIFGEASEVSEVTLNSVNLAGENLGFEIELVFNPGYFDEPI